MSITGVIPRTAHEALELWDKGEAIAAFTVETEGATQEAIYAAAFELIRGGKLVKEQKVLQVYLQKQDPAKSTLTKRERDVAHSIAYVALLKGWGVMVAQHLAGGKIQPITVARTCERT